MRRSMFLKHHSFLTPQQSLCQVLGTISTTALPQETGQRVYSLEFVTQKQSPLGHLILTKYCSTETHKGLFTTLMQRTSDVHFAN